MASGGQIGSIRGTIKIDYDGAGIAKAEKDVSQLEKTGNRTGVSMSKVGSGLLVFGGVIAAGFGVAANAAISFEKRMSAVQAVSGATASEMDKLSAKALQLGKDTVFSASDAGLAMEELVKAGLSVDDVLNGAADATVSLAAAGEIALPKAATIASNAMNQFGLSAKELPKVADLIAGAANASAIDVEDFGMSLSQVGAVAHLAGQSFEDTATAIALMGNAGIKGSDAGTSLKTFLSNLIPTTTKAKDAMKELGIVTKDGSNQFLDAKGNFKGLGDIAEILHKSLNGLSEGQKQVALETIFGSDAIRAAAVIAEQGKVGFDHLNEAMTGTTAAEVAAARLDNTAGSIEQLKGSAETLAITIGTALIPTLRAIIDHLTAAVNWFGNLSSSTQQTVVRILGIVGGLALMGGALIKVVGFGVKLMEVFRILQLGKVITLAISAATKVWAAVQWVLNAALLANPIVLIIAAIIALIAIIVLIATKTTWFQTAWAAVWGAVKTVFAAVVAWLSARLAEFIAFWKAVWVQIGPPVMAVFNLIKSIIQLAFAVITAVITVAWTVIKAIFQVALAAILAVVTPVFNGIKNVIVAVFNFLKPFIQAAWNFYSAIISAVISVISSRVSAGFNLVKNIISTVFNAAKAIVQVVWNAISSIVQAGVSRIVSVANGIKAFVDKVRGFFNDLKAAASGGTSSLISFVTGIPGRILGALGNFGALLFNAGRSIIQGLVNGISSMVGAVTGAVGNVLSAARNLLPFSPAKEGPFSGKGWTLFSGRAIIEDLAKGITKSADAPVDAMTAALAGVAATATPTASVATTATSGGRRDPVAAGVVIGSVNVRGVWDYTNPTATRQMVATLHGALDKFGKDHR